MARTVVDPTGYMTAADQTALRVPFPLAVSIWWRGAAQNTFRYVVSKLLTAGEHPSYGFSTDGSGNLRFSIGWGTAAGNSTVSPASGGVFDSAWHHLLGTYDGANVRLYVDGTEVGTGTAETRAISYNTNALYVGCFDGSILFTDGSVAEMAIYNIAPTADERGALADGFSPLHIRPANIVGYWPLLGRYSPEIDRKAGINLTVNGAGTADHLRIVGKPQSLWVPPPVAAGGPHTIVLGQAVETDTAQPVGRVKTRALGQVTETDSSQPLSRRKVRGLAQTTEADTANTVARIKVRATGLVTEADTATAVARSKTKTLGQPAEADTCQPTVKKKTRTCGQVAETDTAQALARRKARLLGQAVETDTSQPVSSSGHKFIAVGQALETDTAVGLTRAKLRLLGGTVETDSINATGRAKARLLGLSAETGTVIALANAAPTPIPATRFTTAEAPTASLVAATSGPRLGTTSGGSRLAATSTAP